MKKILLSLSAVFLVVGLALVPGAFAAERVDSCSGNFPTDVENVRLESLSNSIIVKWNPAEDDKVIAGYEIHYGTKSVDDSGHEYQHVIDLPDTAAIVFHNGSYEFDVQNLQRGLNYYFTVIAYDGENPRNESACWAVEASAKIQNSNPKYLDVRSGHEFFEAVYFLTEQGIVSGYDGGYYRPQGRLNRAELLKILVGSRYPYQYVVDYENDQCFTDVPAGQWYTSYVCFAKAQGIVGGYSDGSFRPNQNINLVETLKIALETYGYSYQHSDPWYRSVVDVASANRIIPLSFADFDNKVMRGEMADMVTRLLKQQSGTLKEYLGEDSEKFHTYETLDRGFGPTTIFDELGKYEGEVIELVPVPVGSSLITADDNPQPIVKPVYDARKLDNFEAAYKRDLCATFGPDGPGGFSNNEFEGQRRGMWASFGFDIENNSAFDYYKLYINDDLVEEFYETFLDCVDTIDIANFERLMEGDHDHAAYQLEVDEIKVFSYFDEKPQYIRGAVPANSGRYVDFEIIVDRANGRTLYNFFDLLLGEDLVDGEEGLILQVVYGPNVKGGLKRYNTEFKFWDFDQDREENFIVAGDIEELSSDLRDLLYSKYGTAIMNFFAYPQWSINFSSPTNIRPENYRDGDTLEPMSFIFMLLGNAEPGLLDGISQPPETLVGECSLLNSCNLVTPYFAVGCDNLPSVMPLLDGPPSGQCSLYPFTEPQPAPEPSVMKVQPTWGDTIATIETSFGDIKVLLYEDEVPKTVENFVELSKQDKYDDTIFHRVIEDFMIQAGDFENKNGTGGYSFEGPGTKIADEFDDSLKHIKGALSMANSGPNTAGSQFFIVHSESETDWLNGKHAVFAYVYDGMDVVDEIAGVPVGSGDKPLVDVKIIDIDVGTY
jgi:peptidyl-prolyl cis-trans isomerase B (cyclophilin B)